MRRNTCLRSTNGAKATKSSTVRLPKLRSSNKHSGSKHIDYSGNSDGGDGDEKCNRKYISLVCNIRNNQPATKCCWVLWKLLFFLFSSIFLVLFLARLFQKRMKNNYSVFFFISNQKPKQKLIYCSYVSEMGALNARSHKFSFSAWINFNKEHNKSFQSVNNNNIRSKNNNNNHNHTNLNSSKMPVYNIIARRHKVREISIQQ